MTWYNVYIGSLEDPDFHREGGDPNGNIPNRLTPEFPDLWRDFFEVVQRIETRIYEGKQVDFDGWVAKVNKQQIQDFLDDRCAAAPDRSSPETTAELRNAIDALEPDKLYALVAAAT